MIILIEIFICMISLYALGKKVFHFLHFPRKAYVPTLMFSVLYFLVIYFFGQISLGQEAIKGFTREISAPVVLLFTLYPIVVAFSEELFFRVYLSQKTTMLPASLLFTMMHWRPNSSPTLLMFGLLFLFAIAQWSLLQKTKSLWPIVITHLVVTYSLLFLYR